MTSEYKKEEIVSSLKGLEGQQKKDALLSACKYYLKSGFSVIPVGKDKRPLIQWKEFQERKPSEDEVSKWIETFPDMQIGAVTGKISGIIVVDIESGGSVDWLPKTAIAKTGGGGFHYYYSYVSGMTNKVRIRDLTDIRSDGGYVIIPPSYSDKGEYSWIVKEPPQPFPIHLFQEGQINTSNSSSISSEYPGYGKGQRNNEMTRYIGFILAKVHPSEWETIGWNIIAEANTKNDPPLNDSELRNTFISIMNLERRNNSDRWYKKTEATVDTDIWKEVDNKILTMKEISDMEEYGAGDHYPLGFKLFDDALEGGFEDGDLIILSGQSGHGKTTMSQNLSVSFAEQGFPVLFISYEVKVSHLYKKFKEMGDIEDLPIYSVQKNTTGNVGWIEEKIKEAKELYAVKFVFIDHLGFLMPKASMKDIAQNYSVYVGHICRELKQIALRENVVIVMPVHVRKTEDAPDMNSLAHCLEENQLIYLSDGQRIRIKDIVNGQKIIAKKDMKNLVEDTVKNVWQSGVKKIYRLTTQTGREIMCSDGHKFFATTFNKGGEFGPNQKRGIQGWTELKDLSVGQKISVVKKYPEVISDQTISYSQSALLGWIIGDGSISKDFYSKITVSTEDEGMLVGRLALDGFGIDTVCKKRKDANAYCVYLTANRKGQSNGKKSYELKNGLSEFLRDNKINQVKTDKRVPEIIFAQPNEVIGGFLSGLFHADGSITKTKNNSASLSHLTISKQLARDVQHLLLRFGIMSNLRKCKNNYSGYKTNNEIIYKIELSGQSLIDFVDKIGFFLHKQEKASIIASTIRPKRKQKNIDMFYDRITSIEYVKDSMTYDMEVEGTTRGKKNNSFCVQDIVTHNSAGIAQESDCVIIVHRDKSVTGGSDYYSSETRIMMVKNRKTGQNVQGYFKLERGRFCQVDRETEKVVEDFKSWGEKRKEKYQEMMKI